MQSLQKTSKSDQLLLAFELGHGQIFNRGSGSPLSKKSILGFWVWCQCYPTWWAQVKVVVFTASGFYFSTGGAFGTLGWVDLCGVFPILKWLIWSCEMKCATLISRQWEDPKMQVSYSKFVNGRANCRIFQEWTSSFDGVFSIMLTLEAKSRTMKRSLHHAWNQEWFYRLRVLPVSIGSSLFLSYFTISFIIFPLSERKLVIEGGH